MERDRGHVPASREDARRAVPLRRPGASFQTVLSMHINPETLVTDRISPPTPPPSRTNWTRLVPPLVLTGHADQTEIGERGVSMHIIPETLDQEGGSALAECRLPLRQTAH